MRSLLEAIAARLQGDEPQHVMKPRGTNTWGADFPVRLVSGFTISHAPDLGLIVQFLDGRGHAYGETWTLPWPVIDGPGEVVAEAPRPMKAAS